MEEVLCFVDIRSREWRKNPAEYLAKVEAELCQSDPDKHMSGIAVTSYGVTYGIKVDKFRHPNNKSEDILRLFVSAARPITNWVKNGNVPVQYMSRKEVDVASYKESSLRKRLGRADVTKGHPLPQGRTLYVELLPYNEAECIPQQHRKTCTFHKAGSEPLAA